MTAPEALNILAQIASERVIDARRDGLGITADILAQNAKAAYDVLAEAIKPKAEV